MRLLPAVAAVLLLTGPAGALRADEGPVRVHGSFAEALAEARAKQRVLLVVVGGQQHDPEGPIPRPAARGLDFRPVVAAVSGRLDDPQAEALRVRYRLLHLRAAGLVLAPDGAKVGEFDPRAQAADLRASLADAKHKVDAYLAERAGLLAPKDAAALAALLNFDLDHRNLDPVLQRCRQAIATTDAPLEVLGAYASALGAAGNGRAEAEVLGWMIDRWSDHAGVVEWRIGRATAHLSALQRALARGAEPEGDPVRAPGAEALLRLADERRGAGRELEEARIRAEILENYYRNIAEATAHADWIVEHAFRSEHRMDACYRLAQTLDWLGDAVPAWRYGQLARASTDAEAAAARAWVPGKDDKMVERDLRVRARLDPAAPTGGKTARLVARVKNAGTDTFAGLEVVYDGHGPFRPRTQPRLVLEPVGPGEEFEVVFEVEVTAIGELHFVVRAESVDAGTRGTWLKVPVR